MTDAMINAGEDYLAPQSADTTGREAPVTTGAPVVAPDRAEILAQIQRTMAKMFDMDLAVITPEARLVEDLDLDSLDAIELAVKMQEMIGARVDEAALRKMRTIADVVDLVAGMLSARP
jgi:acyl carrier protein